VSLRPIAVVDRAALLERTREVRTLAHEVDRLARTPSGDRVRDPTTRPQSEDAFVARARELVGRSGP
jgi:hypothetical protein